MGLLLLHLLLVSGYSSQAKPLCQNIPQRAWPQNLLKRVLISKLCNNNFPISPKLNSRKWRYIFEIADQCSVCAPLSWSIYIPGRPKGPVNMPQTRKNPDPVPHIYVEIIKTVMRWWKLQICTSILRRHSLPKKLQTAVDLFRFSKKLQRQKVEFAK